MSQQPAVVAGGRPLRRDAAQNRQRLIGAAGEVFAAHGLDASVEEIARVAGVGIGTLYRRFPTKDALIAALVQDVLDTILELAQVAVEQPDGTGLERFLEASSAYQAQHSGCLPRLWNTDTQHESIQQIRRVIAALLEDAKRHGRVREELTSTDLTMVMWSVRGVIETIGDIAPNAWRRQLDILLAGLRPADEALAHRPISQAQVDKAKLDRR
jgi:AcrR family transcriptional regulator